MLNPDRRKQILFPHEDIRPIQDELILAVENCVKKKKHLVVHAPTGLGKTAASLAPAIAYAVENDLTVFFLTSRHTQHRIALKTVKQMEERHDITIPVANLVGKKHMCLQPGVEKLYSGEFVEYCRKLRDDKKCSYYENLKNNNSLTTDARVAVEKARERPDSSSLKVIGQEHKVCPYEIGILAAKQARVIVTDYFYVFNDGIRDVFFNKIDKSLDKSIIVVDEAHNLPDRIKDLASVRTSSRIVERAQSEADKYDHQLPILGQLTNALTALGQKVDKDGERYVTRDDLLMLLGDKLDIEKLLKIGDDIREEQQRSYIGSIAEFLEAWMRGDEGFTRILTKGDDSIVLSFRCLDPGVVAGPIVPQTHSTILMSGTLTPTVMYAEILDIPLNSEDYTFQSPFPDTNRKTLIVPLGSTKYQARSEDMYKNQGQALARMTDAVPGNSIIFFPSYFLMDKIGHHFQTLTKKPVLQERRGLGKGEREELLKKFATHKQKGAVLLAVTSGSFGEGVDFPGDLLKAVIVVGLPLARPDKETQALIQYYDEKFSRGWDYGYSFPAFNRVLQSAGRCIRSETDRGVLIFMDARYDWRNYSRLFPPHWDLVSTVEPWLEIKEFFGVRSEGSQNKLF